MLHTRSASVSGRSPRLIAATAALAGWLRLISPRSALWRIPIARERRWLDNARTLSTESAGLSGEPMPVAANLSMMFTECLSSSASARQQPLQQRRILAPCDTLRPAAAGSTRRLVNVVQHAAGDFVAGERACFDSDASLSSCAGLRRTRLRQIARHRLTSWRASCPRMLVSARNAVSIFALQIRRTVSSRDEPINTRDIRATSSTRSGSARDPRRGARNSGCRWISTTRRSSRRSRRSCDAIAACRASRSPAPGRHEPDTGEATTHCSSCRRLGYQAGSAANTVPPTERRGLAQERRVPARSAQLAGAYDERAADHSRQRDRARSAVTIPERHFRTDRRHDLLERRRRFQRATKVDALRRGE